MAAGGYPDAYSTGESISGLAVADSADCKVFHAGTQRVGDKLVTQGGRVLCVTAKGATLQAAQARAYQRVKQIDWPGAFYRRDIGYRAIRVTEYT